MKWYKQGEIYDDTLFKNKDGIKIRNREIDEKEDKIKKMAWDVLVKAQQEYKKRNNK